MSDTKCEIYLHLVWATKGRQPLLTEPFRQSVHNCIASQTTAAGAKVLAVGGTDNHVHVVVQMSATIAVAQVAKQVKGISSLFAKEQLDVHNLYWQSGYAAFSISRSHLPTAIAYVNNQEKHHADGSAMAGWEAPDEYARH